jgi:hypothetical protein
VTKNINTSDSLRNPITFIKAVASNPKDFALGLVEAGNYFKQMIIGEAFYRKLEHKIRNMSEEDKKAAREAAYDARFQRMHGITRDEMFEGK